MVIRDLSVPLKEEFDLIYPGSDAAGGGWLRYLPAGP